MSWKKHPSFMTIDKDDREIKLVEFWGEGGCEVRPDSDSYIGGGGEGGTLHV